MSRTHDGFRPGDRLRGLLGALGLPRLNLSSGCFVFLWGAPNILDYFNPNDRVRVSSSLAPAWFRRMLRSGPSTNRLLPKNPLTNAVNDNHSQRHDRSTIGPSIGALW